MKNIEALFVFVTLMIFIRSSCDEINSAFLDEILSESALTLINNDDSTFRGYDKENGFYFWVGFGCSQSNSPSEIGYDWVVSQNNLHDTNKIETTTEIQFFNKFDFFSNEILEKCKQSENEIKQLSAKYDYLINRYQSLNSFKKYEDTTIASYETQIPIFSTILQTNKLVLANIAVEYEYDKFTALKKLKNEFLFSMDLLKNSDTISGDLLALMTIANVLNLYDAVISKSDQSIQSDFIMLNNLTNEAISWNTISQRLFLMKVRSITSLFADNQFPNSPIGEVINRNEIHDNNAIVINRYINREYQIYEHLSKCATLDIQNFGSLVNSFPKFDRSNIDGEIDSLGEIILPEIYLDYIKCYQIIDAQISLSNVKQKIVTKKLNTQQISELVCDMNKSNKNSFNIKWNLEKGTISFDVLPEYQIVFKILKNAVSELKVL